MKKRNKRNPILKALIIVLAALAGIIAAALIVFSVAEYRPADVEAVTPGGEGTAVFHAGDRLTVMTWNTGYGALGDNADFFMDGGSSVYTADRARVEQNLADMQSAIDAVNPDILFLQEVDQSSARSCGINEARQYAEGMDGYSNAFARNFMALYVPYPVPPIGHVDSGIMTLTRAAIESAQRVQFPCPFSWPVRLVNLKRCLLISRVPLEGTDRELVLINCHLEAYDDGAGKAAQTEQLRQILMDEAEKGNYVITGGDFNQTFSNVDLSPYPTYENRWQPGMIDISSFDGFACVMDADVPTCRSLDQPYEGADRETFQFYVIDGFILSGNIEITSCEAQDLDFHATDHNPVVMNIVLKQ